MATAVLDLWPGTKVSIGPAIDAGFYYDFEFPDDFRPSEEDLPRIEREVDPFEDDVVAEALGDRLELDQMSVGRCLRHKCGESNQSLLPP